MSVVPIKNVRSRLRPISWPKGQRLEPDPEEVAPGQPGYDEADSLEGKLPTSVSDDEL
jgi:hypothetical protein